MARPLREIVPLNELSKKTLGNYVKKVEHQAKSWGLPKDTGSSTPNYDYLVSTHGRISGGKYTGGPSAPGVEGHHLLSLGKRQKGYVKATQRLKGKYTVSPDKDSDAFSIKKYKAK